MDLSAATPLRQLRRRHRGGLGGAQGPRGGGVFGGFLWDANADKNGILMGFSMGFLWFSMFKKKQWDWIGIEMGFWWDGHVVLMAIWRNLNGIWTAENRI